MSTAKKIYDSSPILLQNALVGLSGAIKSRQRYGRTYRAHREWLNDYDTWSLDRMLTNQSQLLQGFLSFAFEESEFYRRHFDGIDVRSVRNPVDLAVLPILEKEVLRREMSNVYTVSAGKSSASNTGGTTGKSLVVRYTHSDKMKRMAVLDHFKARHGFENRKMRKATFSGKHIVPPGSDTSIFWRYNSFANQMLYSTFHISEKNMMSYVENLNKFKPQALDGFFTSMCDIASFIERKEIKLSFRPVAIFPTSETVTDRGRALLERVFNTRVYDQYASSEGAPFVTECQAGSRHIELSTGVFENYGSSNEILVTSFHTHGTPLIRYRIGDAMEFDQRGEPCDCGSLTPKVLRIEGRSDDHLLTVDNVRVNSGHVANLFKYMPNSLIQAQVQQSSKEFVKILLVVDSKKYEPKYDAMLENEFIQIFGPGTRLELEHVSEIPREASGKQRLIKNTIKS